MTYRKYINLVEAANKGCPIATHDLEVNVKNRQKAIDQGIFVGSNKGGTASVSSSDVDFSQQLGRTIAGVSDIWCLAAIATTNNDDAVADVSWEEHG